MTTIATETAKLPTVSSVSNSKHKSGQAVRMDAQRNTGSSIFVTLAGIVFGTALFWVVAVSVRDVNFDEAGLGPNTVNRLAYFHGEQVSIVSGDDLPKMVSAYRKFKSEGRQIVLWLGASQLQMINQVRPGDDLAVAYANQAAQKREAGLAYLQMSRPLASLNDLLGLYVCFVEAECVPDFVIVAVVYNDLRHRAMQDNVVQLLPEIPSDLVRVGGAGMQHVVKAREKLLHSTASDRNAADQTPQDQMEQQVVASLERFLAPLRPA